MRRLESFCGLPTCDDVALNIDKPDEIILTDPYFTDELAHIRLKK